MSPAELHEQLFNYALGEALEEVNYRLRSQKDSVIAEGRGILNKDDRAVRPDIFIDDRETPNVVIECSYNANDANQDAQNRLGSKHPNVAGTPINTVFSVFIDQEFRLVKDMTLIKNQLIGGKSIRYALYQRISVKERDTKGILRWPDEGFIRGSVFDLSLLIPSAATPRENLLRVSNYVAMRVKEAARCLSRSLSLDQQNQIAVEVFQKSPLSGMRTAMVTWLNALLLQQLLVSSGAKGVESPLSSVGGGFYHAFKQLDQWKDIMDINWRSVFKSAYVTLSRASELSPLASVEALKFLIEGVNQISSTRLGSGIDIGAELFPQLSDDRKETAAFYTQASSSEFLATLSIEGTDLSGDEWSDPDLMQKHQLVDMACGTGTLLRAAYRRILNLHEKHHMGSWDMKKMRRDAMEIGIVGIDISPIAAHLTVSSLSAMCGIVDYTNTKIGWVKVGGELGYTGSLELFTSDYITDLLDKTVGTSSVDEKNASLHVKNASVQWIIMNPPYSRTRGGQSAFDISGFSKEERQRCQKRWGTLIAKKPVSKTAGMAASFLVLAKEKCKPNGRIGFVLPLTAAFAQSWQETRAMVERCFDDIIVVSVSGGKALKGKAFSADTNMEEMFLIATRSSEPNNYTPMDKRLLCVTLDHPMERMGIAREMARAVRRSTKKILDHEHNSQSIIVGDKEIGRLSVFKISGLGRPWHPIGTRHPEIAYAAQRLAYDGVLTFNGHHETLKIEFTTIGKLFTVGPTHDRIGHIHRKDPRGAFVFYPLRDDADALGSDRSLWHADSEKQKKLIVLPTHKGTGAKGVGSEQQRQHMRSCRSTLLYARNLRWTSQSLVAATTERPVHGGSSWTTLQTERDERLLKVFSLWANSTLGMMVHWTQGQRTQNGRSTLQIKAIKDIPCPDFSRLTDKVLTRSESAFNAIAKKGLKPTCLAHVDPVRKEIDHAIGKLLELSEAGKTLVPIIGKIWCNEPTVHGYNNQALSFL